MLTESDSNCVLSTYKPGHIVKSQIRIIGGSWRGRKLAVIDAPGLRPTPDRIRETLFNWLARDCRGAIVLDCFAGSGALGIEALSRGAQKLVALEQQPQAVAGLRAQVSRLGGADIDIVAGDALQSIGRLQQRFDIVFIDPPYAEPQLRKQVFEKLEAEDRLSPGALIYFEWPDPETFELPSDALQWLKQKSAGRVNYALAEWKGSR
jgi:16S rRNA (guanine966-N2)-methyltransferase